MLGVTLSLSSSFRRIKSNIGHNLFSRNCVNNWTLLKLMFTLHVELTYVAYISELNLNFNVIVLSSPVKFRNTRAGTFKFLFFSYSQCGNVVFFSKSCLKFYFQLVNCIREAIDRKQENMRRRRRRDALRLQLVRVFDMAARQVGVLIFDILVHC